MSDAVAGLTDEELLSWFAAGEQMTVEAFAEALDVPIEKSNEILNGAVAKGLLRKIYRENSYQYLMSLTGGAIAQEEFKDVPIITEDPEPAEPTE